MSHYLAVPLKRWYILTSTLDMALLMDNHQVESSGIAVLNSDEVMLSDRAFETDPSQILIESSDPHKLRFRLIEWLAESPNRKVKAERKREVQKVLGFKQVRQVERLLVQLQDTFFASGSSRGHSK